MATKTDLVALERRCLESARRSTQWLLERQQPDGGWVGLPQARVDAFYKASWAFSLMGEAAAAERSLDYVKAHLLQPDGNLGPRGHVWHTDVHYQYASGWLTIGAHKQGRYDVSVPAARFLLTQQDPDHGGFYSLRSSAGQKMRSDTMSTGIAGVACLAIGNIEAAKKVAECYERMIEMQPDPQGRFYATIEADGTLGTTFSEDQAVWRVIDTEKKDQCWYAVGLPFTFAILLHQATGDERYHRLAQWFFDFQSRCINPWDGGSSGKAGWGCSMLYRITGEPHYREIALRVAQNEMNCQGADGSFRWGAQTAYGNEEGDAQKPLTDGDIDLASEFTVWLALIGSNLLARDGG